jgi:hypothetical protein
MTPGSMSGGFFAILVSGFTAGFFVNMETMQARAEFPDIGVDSETFVGIAHFDRANDGPDAVVTDGTDDDDLLVREHGRGARQHGCQQKGADFHGFSRNGIQEFLIIVQRPASTWVA